MATTLNHLAFNRGLTKVADFGMNYVVPFGNFARDLLPRLSGTGLANTLYGAIPGAVVGGVLGAERDKVTKQRSIGSMIGGALAGAAGGGLATNLAGSLDPHNPYLSTAIYGAVPGALTGGYLASGRDPKRGERSKLRMLAGALAGGTVGAGAGAATAEMYRDATLAKAKALWEYIEQHGLPGNEQVGSDIAELGRRLAVFRPKEGTT